MVLPKSCDFFLPWTCLTRFAFISDGNGRKPSLTSLFSACLFFARFDLVRVRRHAIMLCLSLSNYWEMETLLAFLRWTFIIVCHRLRARAEGAGLQLYKGGPRGPRERQKRLR